MFQVQTSNYIWVEEWAKKFADACGIYCFCYFQLEKNRAEFSKYYTDFIYTQGLGHVSSPLSLLFSNFYNAAMWP